MSRCLDDNGLADLFGGAADDIRSGAVDSHVAGCDSCRRLVGTYARLFGESATVSDDDDIVHAERGAAPFGIPLPHPMVLARAWAEAQIGRTIGGRWRLARVLGIGGSAAVFEAVHRNGSRVAIKILRPEHLAIASLMGRFMREAYVANRIEHPGVVRVIDDGVTDEGAPFLVMDLLEGQTLRERVEVSGPLGEQAAMDLCAAALDVLAKAHARGVVHRDLKPDNLFFDASGALRVLDFGIARLTTAEGAELTQTGLGMGTSAYMPPEQARGEWEEVGPRSDLWALAATTVFALARRPPHVAANPQKTLVLAATTSAPSVASMVPDVGAGLARALDRALAFDPQRRPRDARAMAEEIAAARAPEIAAARAPESAATEGNAARAAEGAATPAARAGVASRRRTLAVTSMILLAGAGAAAGLARITPAPSNAAATGATSEATPAASAATTPIPLSGVGGGGGSAGAGARGGAAEPSGGAVRGEAAEAPASAARRGAVRDDAEGRAHASQAPRGSASAPSAVATALGAALDGATSRAAPDAAPSGASSTAAPAASALLRHRH